MFPYWLIYGLWAAGAVQYSRARFHRNNRTLFVVAAVLTALFIGLRFAVGGDWGAYQGIYDLIYFQPLGVSLRLSDPGYAALNWFFAQINVDVWAVNLVCAILFMAGVGRLATAQPNPWLAIVIAVPYLIIVVAMGYTRQAAAIGLICYVIADASEKSLWRMVGFVAAAALFHKTAVLMLPVMLAPILTRRPAAGVIGCLLFAIVFSVFLQDTSDRLITNYAQSNYDSQGAAIRIAMNVLAAGLFLPFRNRMGFTPYQRSFWTYNALLAVASVPALILLSASSGVDRLSLFLIPLQLIVFSRLPSTLGYTRGGQAFLTLGVIAYSFAIQFVWLNYAANAWAWVPYDSVLISLS